jgi:anti-sigma-K factor RskA
MNTHELIESTMLHALGMLDDSERQAYEAAFAGAPVSVQLQVREEARRMADLGDLIPESEPSPELRSLVLAAVRAAMREEENEARIAQSLPNAALPNPVVGRIDPSTIAPVQRATSQPKLSSSPRVHRMWRVATVGFAAASIALGVVTVSMQQSFQQMQSKALVNSFYDTIGAKYMESTILDGNTKRVALTAETSSSTPPLAAVWANPDWDTARLFVKNLSSADANKSYRLVLLDEEGNIFREIKTFMPTGEFQDFDVDVNLITERSLAIYPSPTSDMIEDINSNSPVLTALDSSL